MTSSDESILPSGERNVPDYLLESADELRKLRLEVVQLKSDLDIANARAAFYEDQAGSIQEIVKAALRYAFEIRQKAERQAREITEDAQQEKKRLQEELISLAAERDRLQDELVQLRSSLASVQQQRNDLDLERMQLRIDLDDLDRRLKTIREAIDNVRTGASRIAAPPEPSEGSFSDSSGSGDGQDDAAEVAGDEEPAQSEVVSLAAQAEAPGTSIAEQRPSHPDGPGAESEPSPRRRLNLADLLATKPGGDVELVVSCLHGFPKLVEFERALHEFGEIKNFYVRDFRNGIARLVIRLKEPNQRQELQSRLESLPGWNISVTSSEQSKIEIKVTD